VFEQEASFLAVPSTCDSVAHHHLHSITHNSKPTMDYTGRALLQAAESSQDTAPFFGFIGAAAALVFSCEFRVG
jgi:hypothetical protein